MKNIFLMLLLWFVGAVVWLAILSIADNYLHTDNIINCIASAVFGIFWTNNVIKQYDKKK